MDNIELQKRIRKLRKKQGMSQEELAKNAQLSLRTIQRIENGKSDPRGDTLKRLAVSLQVSPDELFDWQIQEDQNLLTILNISQLAFLAFPLLSIIIPLIIWILKKDKIKDVDTVGKSILNFQIGWNLGLFFGYSAGLFVILLKGTVPPWLFYSYVITTGGLYLYNFVLIVINTINYYKKKKVWYLPALKLLK